MRFDCHVFSDNQLCEGSASESEREVPPSSQGSPASSPGSDDQIPQGTG